MAFWGAPVASAHHAAQAVAAALDMAAAVQQINGVHRAKGQPEISVRIGLNTGVMSVGDMGSALRRSYTVIGDAVNLASRLEGLGPFYGVEIVASAATRQAAIDFVWQELDLVRVKGKAEVVQIYTPLGRLEVATPTLQRELDHWARVLLLYRAQEANTGEHAIRQLMDAYGNKVLYQLYAQRLASMTLLPLDPDWDGATRFETK
jgi:adenylate cyclase